MKHLFSLYLLLLFTRPAWLSAQTSPPAQLQGRVVTETGAPLPGSLVTVWVPGQPQPLASSATDAQGAFTLALPTVAGSYAYVSSLGYITRKLTDLSPAPLLVALRPSPQQLGEVVVTGQRPLLEQQADRLIVNVDGKPQAGLTALDILPKVPGIVVRNGNEVLLEGKAVTILLDGRPTRLTGDDLLTLLRTTAAPDISQIEVLATPDASYEAEGNGGIINIKRRRRQLPGYDVTATGTAGYGWKYPTRNSLALSANFRRGKATGFATGSLGAGTQYQQTQTTTQLLQLNQQLLDETQYRTPYTGLDLRLGGERQLPHRTTVGVLVTGTRNRSRLQTESVTAIAHQATLLADSLRVSAASNDRLSTAFAANVNYRQVLDSTRQQELRADVDAGYFLLTNNNPLRTQLLTPRYLPLSSNQYVEQLSQATTAVYSAKTDYTQQLLHGSLATGLKASHVRVANQFDALRTSDAGTVDNGSNAFDYRETIIAAYGSGQHKWEQWTVQPGLRAEYTRTLGQSLTLNQSLSRRYLSWFPSVTVSRAWAGKTLSASYARRIGRPPYQYLNPFVVFLSAYAASQGNPLLQPSFSQSYRLAYTHGNVSLAASYGTTQDVITDLKVQDDQTKITTSLKANLSSYHTVNLTGSYRTTWGKVLQVSYTAGVSYSRYAFVYQQEEVRVAQPTGYLSLTNTLRLPKTWWAELTFYGQLRATYGNQVNLPFSTTGLSGGRQLWHGKGTCTLSVSDLFFTGLTRSRADYGNVQYALTSRYDSRTVRLNLSYRFGNEKLAGSRHQIGSEEEQSRAQ